MHGILRSIISDRDSKFTSKFWTQLAASMGVKLDMSSAFRQQTDGQSERTIQTLISYLRCYTNAFQNNWDENLSTAEFSYNSTYHSTIKMSPFKADLGYNPLLPLDLIIPKQPKQVKDFLENQQMILSLLKDRIQQTNDKMKDWFDTNRKDQKFSVGDQVLLSMDNLDPRHGGYDKKKLGPKFIGPYEVLNIHHDRSYELILPPKLRLHPIFHTSSLRPYYKDDDERRETTLPEVLLADGTIGHHVEDIIDHRIGEKNNDEYLIKWTGVRETTWEPTENLDGVRGLIQRYLRKINKLPTRNSERKKATTWIFF